MSPKPSPTAIALAASLTSLSASAQERGADPLSAPTKSRPMSSKQKQRAEKQAAKAAERGERADLPNVDWVVEPFGFIGGDLSFITSNFGYYPFPRIAPHFGAGLRINQDGDFSVQTEASLDFVGGTTYFYVVAWYTYAATMLNLPLLARHRIQNTRTKRKHFTWGLTFSQKIGESYNFNILGVPFYVSATGGPGYSGYYGYYGGANFANRVLSASIGYQSRKTTKKGGIFEFEMRFNAGVLRLDDSDREMTSNFMFRWNIVPRKRRQ